MTVFPEVFIRNVVLRNFMRPDLTLVRIRNALDSLDNFGFKRLAFLKEFLDAF